MKSRSEELLAALAKKTFLSLWATPNPHRDSCDPRIPNKEICDLLVVFGDDVIIFSDKHVAFSTEKSVDVSWKRWYRRAIEASSKQLFGARDWLKENPNRVFTDASCSTPLPTNLPPSDRARFHLVVVARGATDACSQYYGERGTIMISSREDDNPKPFSSPQPDLKRGFVHVWDDLALEIVLEHLDTTADLVQYLAAKERFFANSPLLLLSGEEDAIALFFDNPVSSVGYEFPSLANYSDYSAIAFPSGYWEDFLATTDYAAWREEVEASKVWDKFVEKTIFFSPYGSHPWGHEMTPDESEFLLRMLASPSRIERRVFVNKLEAMVSDERMVRPGFFRRSFIGPLKTGRPYYTFLVMPEKGNHPWSDNYRQARRTLLQTQMSIIRANNPMALDIVGLATNPLTDGYSSEDYAYLDGRNWSNEQTEHFRELQREIGIFVDGDEEQINVSEFKRKPRD